MKVGDLVKWKAAPGADRGRALIANEKLFFRRHGFGILIEININNEKKSVFIVIWTKSGKEMSFLSENLEKIS